jgi:hypothetical protein
VEEQQAGGGRGPQGERRGQRALAGAGRAVEEDAVARRDGEEALRQERIAAGWSQRQPPDL